MTNIVTIKEDDKNGNPVKLQILTNEDSHAVSWVEIKPTGISIRTKDNTNKVVLSTTTSGKPTLKDEKDALLKAIESLNNCK